MSTDGGVCASSVSMVLDSKNDPDEAQFASWPPSLWIAHVHEISCSVTTCCGGGWLVKQLGGVTEQEVRDLGGK
jgi:hypothetical protein